MPQLIWGPALQVGFTDIDNHHRRLVELLGALDHAVTVGRDEDVRTAVLGELARYTQRHMAFEEKLLVQHGLAVADRRTAEHALLLDDLDAFTGMIAAGQASSVDGDVVAGLTGWLDNHIAVTDGCLTRSLRAAGAVTGVARAA